MGLWGYAFLGLVQGLTEFLPISSSAHLLFLQVWLRLGEPGPFFTAVVHLGTLLAVVVWFWQDLRQLTTAFARRGAPERGYLALLVLGLLPLVPVALLLRGRLAGVFGSPRLAAGLLFLTAGALFGGDRRRSARREGLRIPQALLIGMAQALSVFPGISRSGATVSAGLALGLGRDEAFRFSFLLGIPTFVGAALFAFGEGGRTEPWAGLALGALCAFVSGLFGLGIFRTALFRRRLWPFGVYCLLLGVAGLIGS